MYERYIVVVGDTIESIANMFGVLPAQIVELNGLEGVDNLIPGTEILIPPGLGEEKFTTYRVQSGDNLYAISQKYDIDLETLAGINGLDIYDYLYPDQILLVPKEGVKVYITESEDTLADVATKLNSTINKIVLDNEKIYLIPEQIITYKK
ncbi:MAG: LysM peptidoglycan-binding domain-containing protein [Bacilli bacterium]|nr:LysM peptidoglycan-binding domain-containing protein [Bacilli bacterium]